MMRDQYSLSEALSISQLISLSSSETSDDIKRAAYDLVAALQLEFFQIYRLSSSRKNFKQLVFSKNQPDTSSPIELKIDSHTALFKKAMSSDSTQFRPMKDTNSDPDSNHNNSTTTSNCYYLPIKNHGKICGLLFIGTQDYQKIKKEKKYILQISLAYLKASTRITRLQSKQELTQTTHRLFENSNEAFCRWTEKQGWRFLNSHLLHRIGYGPLDTPIKNIFGNCTSMSQSTWEKCEEVLKRCIQTGKNQVFEYEVFDPNGTTHIFKSKLAVQKRTRKGKAKEITGISTNITNAKKISQQAIINIEMDSWLLQLNSKLFNHCDREAITKNLEEIGTYLGFDRALLRLHEANHGATVFSEWSREGMTPIGDLAPVIHLSNYVQLDQYTFENINETSLPQNIKDAAKERSYQSQILRPMYNNGDFIGYFVLQNKEPREHSGLLLKSTRIIGDTFSMVIAKERILSKLKLSQERFQLSMEAASYGLWELNLIANTIYLSPNYYAMLGVTTDDNKDFLPITLKNIHVDDREKTLLYINQLAENERDNFSFESRHLTVEGEVIWILARGKIVKWDDRGKPLLATGTLTNISHLKKSQMDLQLAYQEAQSARLAKSEFLARMSHEIRTPMNAIIGMSYLALQTDLDDIQRDHISDIDKAAKALLQIIDDILDFSKIEAGKLVIDSHPFKIIKHMERIASRYLPLAMKKNLTFNFTIDPETPEVIVTDSTRLRQILDNLIGNAIKFTDQGAVSFEIKHIHNDNTNQLVFIVSDTGIGLEPDQLDTLFEPFNQGDGSSTRQFGGTGIGLSISRHLVELMGGNIQASGKKGRGSQFRFSIPCNLSNATEENTVEASVLPNTIDESISGGAHKKLNSSKNDHAQDENNTFDNLKGKNVLLVEDNKVNQKVASGTLSHQGMHVTIANNGTEAVYMMKACAQNKFDFILMDIEMPYMGGFEATEAIRCLERHSNVPIIAMTANMIGENKSDYLNAGMNDCISKPIAPEVLYQVLQQQLDSPKIHF